jgi:hypothetical protein
MRTVMDVAKIVRSKNSGPFEITMDIIFKNSEDYHRFLESHVLTKEWICRTYHVTPEQVYCLEKYDAANAIKITLPRPRAQGTIGETDMHAAQQHVPLLYLPFPD